MESAAFTALSMLVTAIASALYGDSCRSTKGRNADRVAFRLIGGGFASAVTAFVGQNYGAKGGTG